MFGAGPWRICPCDETTHRPGRAAPSAGTVERPRVTEITEDTVTVPGPVGPPRRPRRASLSPGSQSINGRIGACQSELHREVGSV